MTRPPRLGLALSGGGALGAAHIGVLDVLAEEGIVVDVVAGTSIGAVVGAAHLTGQLETLRRLAVGTSQWRMAQLADPRLGPGMIAGRRIRALLEEHFGEIRIEELDKPFAAIAADLSRGRERVFVAGSVVDALRASISVPGIFEPVVTADAVLVDGGLLQPMPVAACRALGADRIVAVDLMGDAAGAAAAAGIGAAEDFAASTFDVLATAFVTLTGALTRAQLAVQPADVVVTPAIGHIAPHHFHRAAELIERGREAALAALAGILSST